MRECCVQYCTLPASPTSTKGKCIVHMMDGAKEAMMPKPEGRGREHLDYVRELAKHGGAGTSDSKHTPLTVEEVKELEEEWMEARKIAGKRKRSQGPSGGPTSPTRAAAAAREGKKPRKGEVKGAGPAKGKAEGKVAGKAGGKVAGKAAGKAAGKGASKGGGLLQMPVEPQLKMVKGAWGKKEEKER